MTRPATADATGKQRSAPRSIGAICGFAMLSALSITPGQAASIVGKFGDWTLYSNTDAAGKLCFLAGIPAATEPANLNRDPALFYVSAWVKDGVKSEVSIKLGFPAKKTSEPIAGITGSAPASFKLFVKDDRAYVADATQELKLLEGMKKGAKLTIQAISERGTTVTDTYSLTGITAALQALATGCP